jgi:hypothetical protein
MVLLFTILHYPSDPLGDALLRYPDWFASSGAANLVPNFPIATLQQPEWKTLKT